MELGVQVPVHLVLEDLLVQVVVELEEVFRVLQQQQELQTLVVEVVEEHILDQIIMNLVKLEVLV